MLLMIMAGAAVWFAGGFFGLRVEMRKGDAARPLGRWLARRAADRRGLLVGLLVAGLALTALIGLWGAAAAAAMAGPPYVLAAIGPFAFSSGALLAATVHETAA